VRATLDRNTSGIEVSQIGGVGLATLVRLAVLEPLVHHSDEPLSLSLQAPGDGLADRAGAAGDEDALQNDKWRLFQNPPHTSGGSGSTRMRRPRSAAYHLGMRPSCVLAPLDPAPPAAHAEFWNNL
jgi:hypothetical protein